MAVSQVGRIDVDGKKVKDPATLSRPAGVARAGAARAGTIERAVKICRTRGGARDAAHERHERCDNEGRHEHCTTEFSSVQGSVGLFSERFKAGA